MPDLPPGGLNTLGAAELARGIRDGAFSAEAVARSCLDRISATEDAVRAWTHLDPDHALEQARAADQCRAAGRYCGALHGVPVGIKDIIDTADMPTENGTVLHAGRRPVADAALVARLRAAGAIIIGKTVTTELATYAPGKTRNPHHPEHTPGGSSSGSAAAVAAHMVPLAVGTQTNGSIIRPAAFCGVYGYKPTAGLIARAGVLCQSPALDQIGVFARSVNDAALLATQLMARPADVSTADSVVPPRLAFVRTPRWEEAADDTRAAYDRLIDHLGDSVVEETMPAAAAPAWDWHRTVMETEIAANFAAEWRDGRDRLSASLRGQIERGRVTAAADYRHALAQMPQVDALFAGLYSRYDAILTLSVAGTAPRGLESTGDPAFCTLWTFCGMPAINVPLLQGANGLPLGVQLVGPRMGDARVLRAARWLGAPGKFSEFS